ncbi:MAG: undecaprenyl-diphosphate phosphatase [Cycloclasticus sp.]|jgi:undecaprenyl-diphosphatase|nr:MAG: undecaprenyl-diphosphatase [Cycloclasticus sp. Phe_18]MBV1912449.1 undecaprenyl-diphosphate phosphatase [Cycloclasticus sp.]MDF1688765.1 undecaprenyl-diphosphate phosphatase [Cycloclasticus sp.]MEE4290387.1 undecaprenyl-diphosphate phosphatase [Cycloclasticus sp.]
MDFQQILGLGLLQGLTEFLPISSSAHLILLPLLLGWEDQGLAFDVAVHVGTLVAVVSYFRHDIRQLILGWLASVVKQDHTQDSRLAWMIIIGTIPVGMVGLLAGGLIETYLRSPAVIALATILFGLLLWYSDAIGKRYKNEHEITIKTAIIIGLYQVLALIPGTSRSGITMTAGLFLGLTREAAARFSFLLSIPLIFLAGGLKSVELMGSTIEVEWFAIVAGVVISAISAFACIALFLKMLEKVGMLPFVIYRLVLGVLLLYLYVF